MLNEAFQKLDKLIFLFEHQSIRRFQGAGIQSLVRDTLSIFYINVVSDAEIKQVVQFIYVFSYYSTADPDKIDEIRTFNKIDNLLGTLKITNSTANAVVNFAISV